MCEPVLCFRCRWKTKGIIRSADVVAWNQVNPREGNNLELQVGEAKKNSPALSEVLWCNGRMDCTPPATASNKRMTACGKQARWAIFSDDLQTAWIYHIGSHGERFALYHDALPVPAFLKKEILSRDGLETSAGGLITASSARRQLEAGAMSGLPAAIPKELLPSVAKIQDILAYGRRKQRGQQGLPLTRQERLQQALSRPTMAPFIAWPRRSLREGYFRTQQQLQKTWVVVLLAPRAAQLLEMWGQAIVGLDAIWKLSKADLPVWGLVVEDELGHLWPVGFLITNKAKAEAIAFFLQLLQTKMAADFPDIYWNPIVMMDKDRSIRKAVVDAGFSFLLCEFHVQKRWRQKTLRYKEDQSTIMALLKRIQHAPTEEEEEEARELLQASFGDFYTYFEANWLSADWKDAWTTRNRPGFREGLYNTNNVTEALWKKVVRLDFHQKKAKAPETMLVTLGESTLASHDLAFQQRLGAKKKPRPSRSMRALWIRQAKGWKLAQKGYFSPITDRQFSFSEYYVCFDPWHCSCNFYRSTGKRCKHIFALSYHFQREFPPECCPFDHPDPELVQIPMDPAAIESDPSDDSDSDPSNASSDDSSHVNEDTTSDDDKEEDPDDDHCHPDEAEAADSEKEEEETEEAHDGGVEADDSEKEDLEWSTELQQPMLNFSYEEEQQIDEEWNSRRVSRGRPRNTEKHFVLPTGRKKKPSKQQLLSEAISSKLENSRPKQPPSAKPRNCKSKATTGKRKAPSATGTKAPRNKAKPLTNKAVSKHKPPASPASTKYLKKKAQGHYGMTPLSPWKGDVSNRFSPAPPGSMRTRRPNPRYQNEELIVPHKPAQQARKTSSTTSISSSVSNSISASVPSSISSSSSSFIPAPSHSSASFQASHASSSSLHQAAATTTLTANSPSVPTVSQPKRLARRTRRQQKHVSVTK
ncbi:Transcription factor BYE1 [Balamuthia mandrillaris]